MMIFKIDFEKAFDSVSWDFLFQVIVFMGFSSKWISWISGCLSSAKTSVLVNGSPTDEFHLHRGLRQGDPLSPFLFIMIMEGLHVAVEDAILAGYFRGVTVGSQNISHLRFADDVLFLASKAKGGLCIRSLESLNHALIQKWHWRFLNTPTALWVMTIKAIHNLNGDFSFFNCSVKDIWMGDTPLQHLFPRLFRLNVNQDCTVRDKWNDGWNWIWTRSISGGTTSTQLSNLTTLLNPIILTEARDDWKLFNTRYGLVFMPPAFGLKFTLLDLPYTSPSSLQDVYAYVDQLHFQKDRKLMLEAIFGVVLWTLWSF
ncbi:RNA-directed DNA polymerase, eukaryota, reverse transcriptase zinc-binding domain protein [Tanacetum coccineum]